MQITPRQALLQFAHVLQQELFPHLEQTVGPLSPQMQLLASISSVLPIARLIADRKAATGRPARDRAAMATAFIAKAVFNLPTTRALIDRLRADYSLRLFCGWISANAVPNECKFSRAFAEFANTELPQQLHQAFVEATQKPRLVGHIARDSTAIPARERFPETVEAAMKEARKTGKKMSSSKSRSKRTKGSFQRARADERGTRIQRQRHQSLDRMLSDLPRTCDIGAKADDHGNLRYWRGYKLHLDVADGQIPISAVLTSANVNDSQVAIPLMTMSSKRVDYLYELMDSAYDAAGILEHSQQMNHVPIAAIHPRRGTKKPSPLTKARPAVPTPQLTWAQTERFKIRTMIERVFARLKDEFGCSLIRVRGGNKVMAHLMYGIVALSVDQWLKLTG